MTLNKLFVIFLCLLLVLNFCGCAIGLASFLSALDEEDLYAAETPVPEETPIEHEEDTPAVQTDLYEGESWNELSLRTEKLCERFGWEYSDLMTNLFIYAREAEQRDWSGINGRMPELLYEYPFDIGTYIVDGVTDGFLTNTQVLKEYSAGEIQAVIAAAIQVSEGVNNVNIHEQGEEQRIRKTLSDVYPHTVSGCQTVESTVDWSISNELVCESHAMTDETLVYRKANGLLCVRLRVYSMDKEGTEEYFSEMGTEPNKWNYCDVEYTMMNVDDYCRVYSQEPWSAPYGVCVAQEYWLTDWSDCDEVEVARLEEYLERAQG